MMAVGMFVMLVVGSCAYDDEQSTLLQATDSSHTLKSMHAEIDGLKAENQAMKAENQAMKVDINALKKAIKEGSRADAPVFTCIVSEGKDLRGTWDIGYYYYKFSEEWVNYKCPGGEEHPFPGSHHKRNR